MVLLQREVNTVHIVFDVAVDEVCARELEDSVHSKVNLLFQAKADIKDVPQHQRESFSSPLHETFIHDSAAVSLRFLVSEQWKAIRSVKIVQGTRLDHQVSIVHSLQRFPQAFIRHTMSGRMLQTKEHKRT